MILSPAEAIEAFRVGRALEDRGDIDHALSHYEQAIEGLRAAENMTGLAAVQAQRGSLLSSSGEPSLALECLLEATDLFIRTGHAEGAELTRSLIEAVGITLLNQAGDALERNTEFTDAAFTELLDRLRASVRALRVAGDARPAAGMLAHLISHYYVDRLMDREEYPRAIDALREVIPLKRELGEPATVARAFGKLGLAQQSIGDLDQALASHRQAEHLFRELRVDRDADAIDAADGLVMALGNQTLILERVGQLDEALRRAREALQIARANGFGTVERLTSQVAMLERRLA